MIDTIEQLWQKPRYWSSRIRKEHVDINAVMLATSLVSRGYFSL